MSKVIDMQAIPYSNEAEMAVLGACITQPDALVLASEYLVERDFYLTRHQWIWHALKKTAERGDTVDIMTVSETLRQLGKYDDVGGLGYMTKLTLETPSSAHAETYALIVWRAARRRELLVKADAIKELAVDEALPLETVMAKAEGHITDVSSKTIARSEKTLDQALSLVIDEIEEREGAQGLFYLPTGMRAIDTFCSGLERGCLHIIGGKPGMGKTSLVMNMIIGAARHGVRVGFISNEMTIPRMTMRIAAMESGINLQSLKRGDITDQERGKFLEAVARLASLPVLLDYIPETTVPQVHAKLLRWQREIGVDLLVIDGLWKMQAPEYSGDKTQRNGVNGYIGDKLVNIAKDMNLAVVLTHQLTKAIDYREDKRPTSGDLEYGGQVHQHADVVILIYRDEVYNEATEFPNQADLIFDKNRDAPTGTVSLYFDRRTTRFYDSTPVNINLRELSPKREYVDRD